MSGTLAPSQAFWNEEDYYLAAELPENKEGVKRVYSLPPPYFERQEQAEALYHYDHTYQTMTPPSRTKVSSEQGLGWRALLTKRGLIGLLSLLVGGWLLLGGFTSLLSGNSDALEIYLFEHTTIAPVLSQSVPPISGNSTLLHVPTIEPAKINAILQRYNSPAVGSGQSMYDLGVRYGIDPAYALAFFIHESSAGTQGVASITRSIGNIRCTPGYICLETVGNGSFRRYASWEAGMEDWYKLIKELYIGKWGLKTLEQIIPVYAPSADHNSPTTYIQQVAKMVDSWQNEK
ncbi:MAG: glucosaminidase domain-containing protein [Chloroflexi bacterium]|nr:glucosaminidase domain-containing protein [Chloroflexota bacterium]